MQDVDTAPPGPTSPDVQGEGRRRTAPRAPSVRPDRDGDDYGPIRTKRVYEEICLRIRDLIGSGRLRPGDRLPTERALAEGMGVSRLAVREALRSLEIAGMVRLKSGRTGGAFIREDVSGAFVQPMQDMLDLGHISLEEVTEVRLHVLDMAVRLAVERASDAEFDLLDANVDLTEQLTAEKRFAERTWVALDFYFLLVRATRNKAMYVIAEPIIEILRRLIERAGPGPDIALVASRRAFMRALRARDADAATVEMRVYLRRIHEHLMQWQEKMASPEQQPARQEKRR